MRLEQVFSLSAHQFSYLENEESTTCLSELLWVLDVTHKYPPKRLTPSNHVNGGGSVTESMLILLAALTDQ